ncbi:MAG: hypothetical protein AAFR11_08490 [Pseudomonadota bacterium]
MSADLAFAPALPWPAYWALAALLGAVVLTLLWRRARGSLARSAAALVLLAALAGPQLVSGDREPLNDIAVVLVDRSGSQSLGERPSRTQETLAALNARLAGLDGLETRVVETEAGGASRLAAAVEAAVADIPRGRRAGVLAVSDGRALDIDPDATSDALQGAATRVGAPVHLVSTQGGEFDIRVEVEGAPRYGVVGEEIAIEFTAHADGSVAAGPIPVEARIDGESVGRGSFVPGATARFDVPVRRAGPLVIELEAEAAPSELTLANNTALIEARGVRDRLRVLLISGEPHPGQRSWRNLLKSDPSIDLVHFTILRPLEKSDSTPPEELALIPFPTRELFIEKLTEFDLIIFDRYTYRGVLLSIYFDNIVRYVEAGGALLIASGPEFAGPGSLAAQPNLPFVLPAAPSGRVYESWFRPARTDLGRRHPVTASLEGEDAWGRWGRIVGVSAVAGEALMQGRDGAPLLVVERIKEGRSALLLSDHVWLWARGFEGGGPYTELMRRVAHWLMGEPDLQEEALRARIAGDELIVERRSLSETPPEARYAGPDGEERPIDLRPAGPGLFRGEVRAEDTGVYRARSDELYAVAVKDVDAGAELAAPIGPETLASLAEATGGGAFGYEAPPDIRRVGPRGDRSGANWAGLVRNGATRDGPAEARDLLPPGAALAILLAVFALAWALEGGLLRRRDPA